MNVSAFHGEREIEAPSQILAFRVYNMPTVSTFSTLRLFVSTNCKPPSCGHRSRMAMGSGRAREARRPPPPHAAGPHSPPPPRIERRSASSPHPLPAQLAARRQACPPPPPTPQPAAAAGCAPHAWPADMQSSRDSHRARPRRLVSLKISPQIKSNQIKSQPLPHRSSPNPPSNAPPPPPGAFGPLQKGGGFAYKREETSPPCSKDSSHGFHTDVKWMQ